MAFKVGYDFDGVLAEGPPLASKSWMRMNGPERAARKLFLLDWYRSAQQLFVPPENDFLVITARKDEPLIRAASMEWLVRHLRGKRTLLFMLQESRSIEAAVRFKAGVIQQYALEEFTEDNKKVVTLLRKECPKTKIWLYHKGERSL